MLLFWSGKSSDNMILKGPIAARGLEVEFLICIVD